MKSTADRNDGLLRSVSIGCHWVGYPRKAGQVGRDSGALRAPLSRLKLVPIGFIVL